MSLYYEAATLLSQSEGGGGSLKSRVYGSKSLKNSPGQVFALLTETTKWSIVLKDVIERSGLLATEKKLTPQLALLLTHDFLLSKNGVAAPTNHGLRLAVERHKARIRAEFTKARLRLGFSSLEALRSFVDTGSIGHTQKEATEIARLGASSTLRKRVGHPRWIRVNTLRTTLEIQLSKTFAEYTRTSDLSEVQHACSTDKILFVDSVVPDLLALPPNTNVSSILAYLSGALIVQDKASCFPALMLNPSPMDGSIIDACAAPGNKTTHIAAMIHEYKSGGADGSRSVGSRIFAFERDAQRTATLKAMIARAGASKMVVICGATDFLTVDPTDSTYADVGALLLDPSCSGSGIVGRDEDENSATLFLPQKSQPESRAHARGQKRKRKLIAEPNQHSADQSPVTDPISANTSRAEGATLPDAARLEALSAFQLSLVKHAMRFSGARKIVYSTCSEHWTENEGVVARAMKSDIAQERGWRVLRRTEQHEGLQNWGIRGQNNAINKKDDDGEIELNELDPETADACVRCNKGTAEGTMGFFVVGFVRGNVGHVASNSNSHDGSVTDEEEWEGFDDGI